MAGFVGGVVVGLDPVVAAGAGEADDCSSELPQATTRISRTAAIDTSTRVLIITFITFFSDSVEMCLTCAYACLDRVNAKPQ